MQKRDNLIELDKADAYNLEVYKQDGGFFRKGMSHYFLFLID